MKKIRNRGLRITGIVACMTGIALLVRPLIGALAGTKPVFSFFGLFDGCAAVIVSAVFLIAGLAVLSLTEPLDEEKSGR